MIKNRNTRFLSLAALVAILSLVGCTTVTPSTSNTAPSNTPTTDIPTSQPSVNSNSSTLSSSEDRIPVEQIDAFVAKLANKNFSYTTSYLVDNQKMRGQVKVDNNNVYYDNNGTVSYFVAEDENIYEITLGSDKNWHKNLVEDETVYNNLTQVESFFSGSTWTDYSPSTNTFTGRSDIFGNVELTIDGDEFEIRMPTGTINFTDINSTVVTIPEIAETVDYIYKDGKFNIVLMNEVLENWFKGDNQNEKDFVSAKLLSNNLVFDEIVFIDPSLENLQVGFIYKSLSRGTYSFRTADFTEENLYEGLKNGEISTKEELQTYLRGIHKGTVDVSSEISIDTTISQEDFNIMTANIFNRLAEVGYQGDDISNEGTKVESLNPDDVVFGFATVKSDVTAGLGIGYMRTWTQYYGINDDDQFEWVRIRVASSEPKSELGPNYMVLNDVQDCWYVPSCEITILDKGNADIHTATTEIENSKEL